MLFEFSELDWLFHDSEDIESFLNRIIDLIYKHMRINGCSVYLWDQSSRQLVFTASEKTASAGGLSRENLADRHIAAGDGECGKAMESGRIEFDSRKRLVMAVPIKRGNVNVGVLRLERARRPFNRIDEGTIKVLASQLANILENARLFYSGRRASSPDTADNRIEFSRQLLLQGTGTSPGLGIGELFILDRRKSFNELHRIRFERVYSMEELDSAIEKTGEQLLGLQKSVEQSLSDSASLIFTSHLMILKDRSFRTEIRNLVSTGINPPAALLNVTESYISAFANSDNPFVREKVEDLEDLIQRIFSNLLGDSVAPVNAGGKIIAAKKLYPSDILTLASEKAAGILLVSGGITAHIGILAQSLKLPLIIIDFPEILKASGSVRAAMDGGTGKLCINPGRKILKEFHELQNSGHKTAGDRILSDKTETLDGSSVSLLANINILPDLENAIEANAEGVGLYRTEYPFLLRDSFPTEEEQYSVYRQVISLAGDRPVTFRTLDAGGDKVLSYYRDYKEENPFLGLRSIRFSLQNPMIFRQQIRAILRAAGEKRIKLMFPMVSTMEEFRTAKDLVSECREELGREGIETTMPELGAMIEIPSLLAVLDSLCEEVDFLSIGTNDFIQYMLAVDRNNEKLSRYYCPHNPSILRGLNQIARAAERKNIDLTVCGEMAHQKEYLPFLLGIGIRSFSVSAAFLYETQKHIAGISTAEAGRTAEEALRHTSIFEIERILGIV